MLKRSSLISTTICSMVVLILSQLFPRIPMTHSFGWTLPPHKSQSQCSSRRRHVKKAEEDELGEDWREFRAKLVLQQNRDVGGAKSIPEEEESSSSSSSSSSSWAYEAGTLIEKGSIVLSRVESALGCHDLRQPYFHKCAVLVLDHDEDSTRGIILNRPSSLVCTDGDILLLEDQGDAIDEDSTNKFIIAPNQPTSTITGSWNTAPNPKNAWPMNFGGDISGLFSDKPMIVALHSLARTSWLARQCSEEVLPNLWVTSHMGARSLIALGEATCEDFDIFYGFSSWEKNMLQREVDRGSWYIVSMDSQSILDSMRQLRQDNQSPREGGIKFWEGWITRIHREKEENVESSRGSFSDLMLKEWCHEMLYMPGEEDMEMDEADIDYTFNMFDAMETADNTAGPGCLLQASSDPTTYMLFDQLLHKSTILILKDEEAFSLGLILNLPTIDSYEHELRNGTKVVIPIRYGGPLGYSDENDDDDDDDNNKSTMNGAGSIIWLHNNEKLRDLGVGKSISEKSSCWTCSQTQALNAIDLGLAKPSDFLAVQGHVLWEKEMGVGGVAGQIASGALVEVNVDRVNTVWTILGNQSVLESLDDIQSTFATIQKAWTLGQAETEKDNVEESKGPRCVYGTSVTLAEFADEALRKWIEIFLLENREYVPF